VVKPNDRVEDTNVERERAGGGASIASVGDTLRFGVGRYRLIVGIGHVLSVTVVAEKWVSIHLCVTKKK